MYERQILAILNDAGDKGLKVAKIARHVYNDCNSLFETHSFEEIHQTVLAFLMKNTKTEEPLVEKVKWGVYRLNKQSKKVGQLIMKFESDNQTAQQEEDHSNSVDMTLDLFD